MPELSEDLRTYLLKEVVPEMKTKAANKQQAALHASSLKAERAGLERASRMMRMAEELERAVSPTED